MAAPKYYTYQKNVPLGGGSLGFTAGKGYYAKPAPPKPPKAPLPGDPNWAQAGQYNWLGGQGGGAEQGEGGGQGRWVTPDYSGILGSFTADARARFGAGLNARKEGRLSNARAIINRLGVRDVPGMLSKLSAYGLTEADLQGAAANPWSELKALQSQGAREWANTTAARAARGGYRSGGSIAARQRIDQELAQREAALTEGALGELSTGLQGQVEWENQQRDAMEQAIAQQQAALAAAYQPYWQQD